MAIVANEGRVAVDAEAPLTNGAVAYDKGVWSYRLGAGVKLLRGKLLGGDGGKKADHQGERAISRKAIAQGMSDALRCPVCSCAHFSCILHTRPRVQRAPGIPCALRLPRATAIWKTSRATRGETANVCLLVAN